jgi:hypothetical protein
MHRGSTQEPTPNNLSCFTNGQLKPSSSILVHLIVVLSYYNFVKGAITTEREHPLCTYQQALFPTSFLTLIGLLQDTYTIYGNHLAWPLVVGALLGKRREEPSPRHLLSFRAPTMPASTWQQSTQALCLTQNPIASVMWLSPPSLHPLGW